MINDVMIDDVVLNLSHLFLHLIVWKLEDLFEISNVSSTSPFVF